MNKFATYTPKGMQGQLPNLIVIGAMKCGTTSLHSYLEQHPDVFMSEKKEIDYFIDPNFSTKDLEWYKNQFSSNCLVRGESSQSYSKCHAALFTGTAQRIANVIPDVKLIYTVRDPIERIRSHYLESVSGDNQKLPFLEFIGYPDKIRENTFILTGNYYLQLSEYLKYFSMDQIHVVALEEIMSDRLGTMNMIFDFLGLKHLDDPTLFEFEKNSADVKTKLNPLGRALSGSSLSISLNKVALGRRLKELYASRALLKLGQTKLYKIELTDEVEGKIRQALAPDIEKFNALIGKKFNWSV